MALGDVAESVDYGITASASETPIGPKFLRITDIQDGAVNWETVPWCECDTRSASEARLKEGDIVHGEIVRDSLRHTDPAIAAKFRRSRVEAGEIVMSIRATVGTTALVPPELDGANLTQGTGRIAPGDGVDRFYLLSFLRASGTQHWISLQVKGATFREITLSRLRELPVTLPPLPLQREFACRVRAVEKLRTAHRASLAELEALFATLQHGAFRGAL